MHLKLFQLFNAAEISVARARSLAAAGRKDEARDWLRFFLNAQIVQLLGYYQGPFPINLARLKENLRRLEDEVHPLAHCDHSGEFSEIKANLDTLAYGIFKLLEKKP